MNVREPDYKACTVNLACSMLKRFGAAEVPHNTLALADQLLSGGHRNVVVLLLDGLGTRILERHTAPEGFFRAHLAGSYSAVFPSTTVAAITSLNSGLTPTQHAWLGWDCYYAPIDKTVTVFLNTVTGTKEPAADYPVARRLCPYVSLRERIHQAGGQAWAADPFQPPNPKTLEDMAQRIQTLCSQPGEKYIYAYWPQPDTTMHDTGCESEKTRREIDKLQLWAQTLAQDLEDTLLLITADHGQVTSQPVFLSDHPEIEECMYRRPSIEARALTFFIKPDCHERFQKAFQAAYGDCYRLYARQALLDGEIFGPGEAHPLFASMTGDYLAVAIDRATINLTRDHPLTGVHAGLTEDEMLVPLIAVSCGKESGYGT